MSYTVSSGQVSSGITLTYDNMNVYHGGVANSTTVNQYGQMFVSSGGTANETTVNRGYLSVSSGGTATAIKENGGYVEVADGANATFAANVLNNLKLTWTATVHSGTTANSTTLDEGGGLKVFSGGMASSTTVNNNGNLYVSSGGNAYDVTISAGGRFNGFGWNEDRHWSVIENGSAIVADNLVIVGNTMIVSSGGVANDTTANSNNIVVSNGGVANEITVNSGGYLYISSGGTASSIIVNGNSLNGFGMMRVYSGGTAINTAANSSSWITVASGGEINAITVNSGGKLVVSAGGTATAITENGGYVWVDDGAAVTFNANVLNGLNLYWTTAVHHGTEANLTTVNNRGSLHVYSGGVVNDTIVNFWGSLRISSCGVANSTTVNYGSLYVNSGGVANDTTVNYGSMYVSSGGIANDTTVNSGGSISVTSGGRVTGALTVAAGAFVSAYEGSVLDFDISAAAPGDVARINDLSLIQGAPDFTTTVSATQKAGAYALAGNAAGFASVVTLTVGGETYADVLTVGNTYTVGVVDYSLAIDGENTLTLTVAATPPPAPVGAVQTYKAEALVSAADIMIGKTIVRGGAEELMLVSSGGTATSTIVKEEGFMYVSSGGIASSTVVSDWGRMYVSSGGLANSTVVNEWGEMYVNGGVASSTVVNGSGEWDFAYLCVFFGGTANETTVNGGSMAVSSGGTANETIVNGGSMFVSSGGTACNTIVYSGGCIDCTGAATGIIINEWGNMNVSSGGVASKTTVSKGGFMHVSSGGIARSTDVTMDGILYISSCGNAYDVTVSAGGRLGGFSWNEDKHWDAIVNGSAIIADNVFIIGSNMRISSGVAANATIVNNHGVFDIENGGTANSTVVNDSGSMFLFSGGVANDIIVNEKGYLFVHSGGSAYDVTVSAGGRLGGFSWNEDKHWDAIVNGSAVVSDNATVIGDSMFVLMGGMVNHTTVSSGGNLYVSNGGRANNTSVTHGSMCVFSGGVANSTIMDTTTMDPMTGEYYAVSQPPTIIIVYSGGVANDTTVNVFGEINVSNGGVANHTVLNNLGALNISGGGLANSTVVNDNGYLRIYSGGVASNIILNSDSELIQYDNNRIPRPVMVIYSGGRVTGNMNFISGARISACEGGIIDFDISTVAPGEAARVNGWSLIDDQGALYTITVSVMQTAGTYALASGVANFAGTITVNADTGSELGTLSVGGELISGNHIYSLVNDNGVLSLIVTVDIIPLDAPIVYASIMTPTNQDVTVTATFSEDTATKQYSLDNSTWQNYTAGVLMSANGTVYFRGIDAAGNISDVTSYAVTNIDKVAPVITLTGDNISAVRRATLTATVDDGSALYYRIGGAEWLVYSSALTVDANAIYEFRATDAAGNVGTASLTFANILPPKPEGLFGDKNGLSWSSIGAAGYVVEYSTDGFAHVMSVAVAGTEIDTFELPSGTYSWRVKAADGDVWAQGEEIVSDRNDTAAKTVASDADGVGDLFFANASGTWEKGYAARHVGVGDWSGTEEIVGLEGRNRIADLFAGSTDANILILTDDVSGDALFVDDIYTSLPGSVKEQQSRISRIGEIRAGAGDDVVDMTSRRFAYTGGGVTIRGGLGNDTIWANKGANRLFGDAGNDRLVGASGNDVLAGGIGNDRMHGGGGNDVFTFGNGWGVDTVAQLADGSVTLWFADGDESKWNAATLTYADGQNSVTVSGVTADKVTLKFGDDGTEEYATLAAEGAFADFTSEKIFGERNKGVLASL